MMNRVRIAHLVLICLLVSAAQSAPAGEIDLGVGLGFADYTGNDAFEGGWDLQMGYTGRFTDDWNMGGQAHMIRGWTGRNDVEPNDDTRMYFRSTALYLTLQPQYQWLRWLQLKGGVVSADYARADKAWSGTGSALGMGVVIGNEKYRLHLLDVYRYQLGGEQFNIYSLSVVVLVPILSD